MHKCLCSITSSRQPAHPAFRTGIGRPAHCSAGSGGCLQSIMCALMRFQSVNRYEGHYNPLVRTREPSSWFRCPIASLAYFRLDRRVLTKIKHITVPKHGHLTHILLDPKNPGNVVFSAEDRRGVPHAIWSWVWGWGCNFNVNMTAYCLC